MSDEFKDVIFKEKPDISQIFLRQLDRTNQSIMADDPYAYEAMVRQYMKVLPTHCKKWILEQSDRYNDEVERWDYKENCGIPMGTPEDPIMRNDPKSIRYDPLKPTTVYSPILITEIVTDYEKLFDIVMEAAEKAGLTWKLDYREKQIPNPKIKITRKKTLYRKPRNEQEEEKEHNPEG